MMLSPRLAAAVVLLALSSCVEPTLPAGDSNVVTDDAVSVQQGVETNPKTVVIRLTVSGAIATASASDALGQLGLEVAELRTSTTGTTAQLNFARNWRDPSSYSCRIENVCTWPKESPEPVCQDEQVCSYTRHSWESFSGQIPAGSFVLSGSMARLTVNLSTAVAQYYERCDADEVAGTVTCQDAGATGAFDLTWTKNGELITDETGTKEVRRPRSLQRTIGSAHTESANVRGSALGYTFSEPGELQQVRGSSLQKEWTLTR